MTLVNPKYDRLSAWLLSPAQIMQTATPIHIGRNTLAVTELDGTELCIKQYAVPSAFKSFVYKYLCKPKGLRAWQHSDLLRQAGFFSPENIAYIDYCTPTGLGVSYYICRYEHGTTLYHWGDKSLEEIADGVIALAQHTAALHNSRLLLRDYTPGNILLTDNGFCLVDTNRMKQGYVSIEAGLRNMAGLWLQPEAADLLAKTYLQCRNSHTNSDDSNMVSLFKHYRKKFWQRFARRHNLHGEIVHHDLDGGEYHFCYESTIR